MLVLHFLWVSDIVLLLLIVDEHFDNFVISCCNVYTRLRTRPNRGVVLPQLKLSNVRSGIHISTNNVMVAK